MSSLKYVDGEKVCIWGWSFGGYITGIQQMRYTQHFLNNIRIGYFFSKTLNFSLSDILIRIIIQFLFFIGFVLRILAIILSFLYNFLFFIFKKYLHFFYYYLNKYIFLNFQNFLRALKKDSLSGSSGNG